MSMEAASIAQHCKTLRLSSIGTQFASLAEEASKQNHSHLRYLEALLQSEVEDRERRSIELRLKDAHLPRIKTLEDFDFAQSPHIPASRIRALAEGGYLERAEPVLLVGEPGTGKTHLATGLAIAACRQRKRVRFTTAAALVTALRLHGTNPPRRTKRMSLARAPETRKPLTRPLRSLWKTTRPK